MPWVMALVGTEVGKLHVCEFVGFRRGRPLMRCRCECGTLTLSDAHHLFHGAAKSCGCARKTTLRRIKTKHGYAPYHGKKPRVYSAWKAMRERCLNPRNIAFKNYGGRGITVCERWRQFSEFLADMGEPPTNKHSIERKDNNGNYEPSNCVWATQMEQASNNRRNWHVTLGGVQMTVAEATRRTGLKHTRIYKFLYRQSASKATVIPVDEFVASVLIK